MLLSLRLDGWQLAKKIRRNYPYLDKNNQGLVDSEVFVRGDHEARLPRSGARHELPVISDPDKLRGKVVLAG